MLTVPRPRPNDTAATYLKRSHDKLVERMKKAEKALRELHFNSTTVALKEEASWDWNSIVDRAKKRWKEKTVHSALIPLGGKGLVRDGYGIPRDHGL